MRVRVGMCRYDANELDDSWESRFALLKSTMEAAFGKSLVSTGELSMFLAPEYFFRKGGYHADQGVVARTTPSGFSSDECRYILAAIQDLTRGKDLMVVPGTIFWLNRDVMRNTLPVIYSGEICYVYNKHSNAEELCPADRAVATGTSDAVGDAGFGTGVASPCFAYELKRTRYRFGVEVCADHCSGVLLKDIGRSICDFHIIVANTVVLKELNVAAMRGRHVILCSALSNRRARQQHLKSSSFRVERVGVSSVGGQDLIPVEKVKDEDDYCVFKSFDMGQLF